MTPKGGGGGGGGDTSPCHHLGDAARCRPHILPIHQDVHRVVGTAPHAQTVPHLWVGGGGAGFKGWWDPPRPPLGPINPLLPLPRVRRAHQTPRTPPTKHHSGLLYPPSVTPRTPKDALDPSKDPPGPPQPTSMTPPPTIRCQDPLLTLPPISPGTPVAPPSPPITSPTSP